MARKVIWSIQARGDKKSIFTYWNEHNKSKNYSRKLNRLFKEAIELLQVRPHIGRKTQKEEVYVKVVRQFLIIYEIRENDIVILSIWDGRRNPDDMP